MIIDVSPGTVGVAFAFLAAAAANLVLLGRVLQRIDSLEKAQVAHAALSAHAGSVERSEQQDSHSALLRQSLASLDARVALAHTEDRAQLTALTVSVRNLELSVAALKCQPCGVTPRLHQAAGE